MADRSSEIKVLWCSPHPTHYGVYLLDHIEAIEGVQVEAVYFYKTLVKYPWRSSFAASYPSHYLNRQFFIDWKFYRKSVGLPRHVLPVIAGWDEPTALLLAMSWAAIGRPFILFTDTPEMKERKGLKQWVRAKVLRFIFNRQFAFFVTGSPGVSNALELGIDRRRIINLPFATNTDFFVPAQLQEEKNTSTVFISSGRLDNQHKAYHIAIEALGLLKQRHPEVPFHYIIAGEGPDRPMIERQIEDWQLQENVELKGWLEPSDLLSFYQSGHALIHPSNFDPFPNAVLEAMACGLPVIGSDAAGSVLDRVEEGVNGYIHQQQRAESLYEKLRMFLSLSLEERRQMGAQARTTALKWHVSYHQRVIKEIVNEYRTAFAHE